jgi:chemotaxis protein MotB
MRKLQPKELESRLEVSERKRIQLRRMLTKNTVEEDTPLWSMVDLMTLLLIFFIFFFATDTNRPLSASQDSPRDRSSLQIESSTIEFDETPTATSPLSRDQTFDQLRDEVLETMDEADGEVFSVASDQRRLVFVLGEQITFNEAEATLLRSHQSIFVRIASFISSKHGYQVVVSGHTDNKPIRTEQFPSNLELSSARAITVAKFLVENGVSNHRVSIQGFSEYHPLVENTSTENRQINRRVEIALIREENRE